MQGYRFYADYGSAKMKRARGQAPNVLALIVPEQYTLDYSAECVAALLDVADSPVCGSAVGREYLRRNCRRITERAAREIHTLLFERLDNEG